ncbi:hypothetical protein KIN20_020928 [Parelaphostrongylus tenuis]|uniref:Uncharacterized protein n=1 Tax=Parelaphostrongylus tenuis TaxID=148309 RepID=A0AAD5MN72_PARTN|nr:hypothetical protein KIN20_020928 [Parelaphostrongylus tenuis]
MEINVTGFSLPVAMAFSTDAAARAQVPQISTNSSSAEAFVKRLIIQGVLDVLEQQGRAAGLPDFAITTILGQLDMNVLYAPLPCPKELSRLELFPMRKHRLKSQSNVFRPQTLIMATWSRGMWQNVVNRVLRMITPGPIGTHFATAVAIVT